LLKNKTAL